MGILGDVGDRVRSGLGEAPNRVLTLMMTVFGALSFVCLFVSITTDKWLYSTERITDATNNSAHYVDIYSGLWKKCTRRQGPTYTTSCSYINYFSHVEKDEMGSTDSILLSLRRAALFPMLSLVVIASAIAFYVFSRCTGRQTLLTIVIGVLYIIGGLFLFVGMIIYIGAITEEASNTPKSMDEQPKFVYQYGPSLFSTVASFFFSELTGTLAIHLFISLRKVACVKHQQQLSHNEPSVIGDVTNKVGLTVAMSSHRVRTSTDETNSYSGILQPQRIAGSYAVQTGLEVSDRCPTVSSAEAEYRGLMKRDCSESESLCHSELISFTGVADTSCPLPNTVEASTYSRTASSPINTSSNHHHYNNTSQAISYASSCYNAQPNSYQHRRDAASSGFPDDMVELERRGWVEDRATTSHREFGSPLSLHSRRSYANNINSYVGGNGIGDGGSVVNGSNVSSGRIAHGGQTVLVDLDSNKSVSSRDRVSSSLGHPMNTGSKGISVHSIINHVDYVYRRNTPV